MSFKVYPVQRFVPISARERKFGGYSGEAGSFLARRDEAAWQVPCNEEQRRQGRS